MYSYVYTFRVEVLIGGVTVIFEADEEGSYRALAVKAVIGAFLQAVTQALEKLR